MTESYNLIATWHPTFAFFHNPFAWGAFDCDVARFKRMLTGKLEKLPKEKDLVTKPTWKDVRRLFKECLKKGLPVALDIETIPEGGAESDERWTGKDPLRCQLQLLGVGCETWGLSHRWTDGHLRVERELAKWLRDPRVCKTLQNGDWFDLRVLARYDCTVENIRDTREMRRVLSSTSPLRLDYLGSIYTDYHSWKADHQSAKDEKGYVFTGDVTEKKRYNIHDCIVTARVDREILKDPDWGTPRVQNLYAHQRRLAEIAASMNTVGIRVDKLRRYFMAWCLKQEFGEKSLILEAAVGIQGWRSSPDNMRALIYKKHAVGKKAAFGRFQLEDPYDPDMYVNPKEMDTIGVNEDQLTLLLMDPGIPEDLKNIINLYWDVQGTWKKRSTYVTSKEISHAIDKDYRLHPNWNSCGADTGRFSGFLMVIPKELRAQYIADKGCVLIGADYRQMELRVMYAVTGDEALGDGIRKGNVYVEEAKDYFSLPPHMTKKPDDAQFDPERHIKPSMYKVTKNTRLAAQYGSGKKKFFSQLIGMDRSTSYDMSMKTRDAFLKRNHRTVEWWEEETEQVHACSYSASRIMDRRRVYPRPPDRPEIANYPIQSTAADVKNLAMIAIDDEIKRLHMKSRIIIDLHDAIYTNTPKDEIHAMSAVMQACMERVYRIQGKDYSFPVDMGIHERWSDFS